jgi:acylphosphatase
VRVRVVVSGRVHGVFFRDTVRAAADEHGVAGWVRNRSDGSVEAEFEGPREAVDAVVEVCRRGPSGAEVSDVRVDEREETGKSGFDVR